MDSSNILIISGGNRKESYTTKAARGFLPLAPEGTTLSLADVSGFPLFNQDLEAEYPAAVTAVKDAVKAADGIIIITPEHNRSIPAVLKNALDWMSRPYGTSAWAKKPVLLVGVTPGGLGAAQAITHLRNICLFLDMRIMGQPEVYLSNAANIVDESGFTDESTREMVKNALAAFAEFVRKER